MCPIEAVAWGIKKIKDSYPGKRLNEHYLEGFIKQLYLSHIINGWSYSKHCIENNSTYLPSTTRVSLWLSERPEHNVSDRLFNIQDIFIPHILGGF